MTPQKRLPPTKDEDISAWNTDVCEFCGAFLDADGCPEWCDVDHSGPICFDPDECTGCPGCVDDWYEQEEPPPTPLTTTIGDRATRFRPR